ncbi:serine hydrolase domain-containing protein [Lacticaseibacillus jixianensis]|uniref:Serine hydrolase domain-containing protein n=1 Tax=Lacticaseibacillus jixianensis TaxID=2486012 RepID=A0ABW4B6R5_9LACO|nr:serine hydrolase domain-containing protein [Lacticaseibacillus jixianensis]
MTDEILTLLQTGQHQQLFSQAVLAIQQTGRLTVRTVGDVQLGMATRFDLASLTKITGTLMGILHLLSTGQLHLETKLTTLFPALTDPAWAPVTIKHLLTHTSGLQSSFKFYRLNERLTVFDSLARVLPGTQGTVCYSDLNFMWLGLVIQAASGEALAPFLRCEVFAPLQMTNTSFSAEGAVPTRAAGKPDDGNASFFEAPVGHAGLFSSATDLIRFAEYWLAPTAALVSPVWLHASVQVQTPLGQPPRGFGWVLPGNPESFFNDFGPTAFGHTGYTGTSLLIVPAQQLAVVLLTDRTRFGTDQRFPDFRRAFHHQLAQLL